MRAAIINKEKVRDLVSFFKKIQIPHESESHSHNFEWKGNLKELANSYLAIVSISHQTSPIGEKVVAGIIRGKTKRGWDYLKEKFLLQAVVDKKWSDPRFWVDVTPDDLSNFYYDKTHGKTLGRINERTSLINNLGDVLIKEGFAYIDDAFEACGRQINGPHGFLAFMKKFVAYKDPVQKKSFFFISIAGNECKWEVVDKHNILSPVDYHELRGHLRIGTIHITAPEIQERIKKNMPITELEDTQLRLMVQEVNSEIAKDCRINNSRLHYLLWNVFRYCCSRDSLKTHCKSCLNCNLPLIYKNIVGGNERCIFSDLCESANKEEKLKEPPYVGNFY